MTCLINLKWPDRPPCTEICANCIAQANNPAHPRHTPGRMMCES